MFVVSTPQAPEAGGPSLACCKAFFKPSLQQGFPLAIAGQGLLAHSPFFSAAGWKSHLCVSFRFCSLDPGPLPSPLAEMSGVCDLLLSFSRHAFYLCVSFLLLFLRFLYVCPPLPFRKLCSSFPLHVVSFFVTLFSRNDVVRDCPSHLCDSLPPDCFRLRRNPHRPPLSFFCSFQEKAPPPPSFQRRPSFRADPFSLAVSRTWPNRWTDYPPFLFLLFPSFLDSGSSRKLLVPSSLFFGSSRRHLTLPFSCNAPRTDKLRNSKGLFSFFWWVGLGFGVWGVVVKCPK